MHLYRERCTRKRGREPQKKPRNRIVKDVTFPGAKETETRVFNLQESPPSVPVFATQRTVSRVCTHTNTYRDDALETRDCLAGKGDFYKRRSCSRIYIYVLYGGRYSFRRCSTSFATDLDLRNLLARTRERERERERAS